ncbi:hypothetical protein FH972_024084 [Carpinus fangiana]|uniref:Calcineurin-like phosphoesterase domain-containing protein n=1 Tax=Carpinus fangiana TaxID=176857 RepID=A0A5N6KXF0_9ROSI|nr:hypothetical protein FH972_024084 [Carpinus fangiana]
MRLDIRTDTSERLVTPTQWSRRYLELFAAWLHQPSSQRQHYTERGGNALKVVCISDTHGTKPQVPYGDILLHAGDMSRGGTFKEIQEQLDWLNAQPHLHKLVIGGNHDIILDEVAVERIIETRSDSFPAGGKRRKDLQWGSIMYLEDSFVTLQFPQHKRSIKIFGSPMTPQYGNWAFQHLPIRDVWRDKIPHDTDILVTHGPPKAHLDSSELGITAGCPHLLRALHYARPRIHVFGHIHAGHGLETIRFDKATVAYERIVVLGEGLGMLLSLLWASAMKLVCNDAGHETVLVNAAAVKGNHGEEQMPAIIITI